MVVVEHRLHLIRDRASGSGVDGLEGLVVQIVERRVAVIVVVRRSNRARRLDLEDVEGRIGGW